MFFVSDVTHGLITTVAIRGGRGAVALPLLLKRGAKVAQRRPQIVHNAVAGRASLLKVKRISIHVLSMYIASVNHILSIVELQRLASVHPDHLVSLIRVDHGVLVDRAEQEGRPEAPAGGHRILIVVPSGETLNVSRMASTQHPDLRQIASCRINGA